jgi:ABC-2 type transport system permease protein
MDKLWLVIKREYLSRVRKKTFILATILTPLAIGVLAFGAGFIASMDSSPDMKILVTDESGIFEASEPEVGTYNFEFTDAPADDLKDSYADQGYNMLIHIPEFNDLLATKHQAYFYSQEKPSLEMLSRLERRIADAIKDHKISQSNVGREVYESFRTSVDLEGGLKAEGDTDSKETGKQDIVIGTVLGGVMGLMMYMVIFIFGGMVMRSVMEEKMNRIVEVMISSVKPFQLMMGKIIGVGGVGLTQLAIWVVLIGGILNLAPAIMGVDLAQGDQLAEVVNGIPQDQLEEIQSIKIIEAIKGINWWLILPSFVLFFLGGYFVYSSLFAAIGSAISDDMGESQSLMLPIMVPVIFAFIMAPAVLENPNGTLALFGSLFPLFSPILMPVRLAFDPPIWQVILSIVLLVGTAVLFVWISSRIYRVGILMYGKKVNYKELMKWLMYKA